MDNILTYIKWRGDLSFSNAPFQEVDNLVFATLSYLRFSKVFQKTKKKSLTIKEASNLFFSLDEQRYRSEHDLTLLRMMAESVRYGKVKIHSYVDHIDEEQQKQFSALAFQFHGSDTYVAYRGTDNTLIGWKEDFNMTFLDTIPSQLEAQEYLTKIAQHTHGALYVGGHSKGGNLAVFASASVKEEIQHRIQAIYNNDGPGFNESMLKKEGYQRIVSKIHSYVPQSSVVGMLLNHEEEYHVVKSTQISLWQHDPYSWQVMGAGFLTLTMVDTSSILMDKTMKNMLTKLTPEQRATFIDAMYDIFQSTNAKSLKELKENKLKNMTIIVKALNNIDPSTRKIMNETLSSFFLSMRKAIEEMSFSTLSEISSTPDHVS